MKTLIEQFHFTAPPRRAGGRKYSLQQIRCLFDIGGLEAIKMAKDMDRFESAMIAIARAAHICPKVADAMRREIEAAKRRYLMGEDERSEP